MTKKEAMEQYKLACEEIAEDCREEGYPDHGSNYELRVEQEWNDFWRYEFEDAEEG